MLCCVTVAAGVVPDSEGAEASLRDVLAAALDANREMARLAAELERVRADLAVLPRMVFGRSSERARPEPSADGGDAGQGRNLRGSGTGGKKRGPVARAGRRDYSHLPRVEVAWDFGAAGTAARSAGRRSRAWAAITWRSSWTGW